MATKYKPWKHERLCVAFLVKKHVTDPSLLLGYKLTGVVANLVMPVGGHLEDDDLGPIAASQREAKEESGLYPTEGHKIAELRVKIERIRLKILVDIIEFNTWTGRLKNRTPEFAWLKFIKFSKIPWDDMPPGERPWFEDVLLKRKRRLVHIRCGENRKDVKSVRISPLR